MCVYILQIYLREYHEPHKDSWDRQDWGLTLEALPPRGGGSAECPKRTGGEWDAGVENKNTQNTPIDLNKWKLGEPWVYLKPVEQTLYSAAVPINKRICTWGMCIYILQVYLYAREHESKKECVCEVRAFTYYKYICTQESTPFGRRRHPHYARHAIDIVVWVYISDVCAFTPRI